MNGFHLGFSSLQEISACERATCLLDQPSIAKISKINDRIATFFEQGLNSLLRAVIVCRNKCDPSRSVDDRLRLQVRNEHMVKCLNHSCTRGQRRNKLAD